MNTVMKAIQCANQSCTHVMIYEDEAKAPMKCSQCAGLILRTVSASLGFIIPTNTSNRIFQAESERDDAKAENLILKQALKDHCQPIAAVPQPLSARMWLAGICINGMLSSRYPSRSIDEAIAIADDLLKALEQP